MSKIISIANQKGGVGKTTTAINLSSALSKLGRHVLVVDFDPQGNAGRGFGVDITALKTSICDVLSGRLPFSRVVLREVIPGVDIIPSNLKLAAFDITTNPKFAGQPYYAMKGILDNVKDKYDYIIIDCPPSLGLFSINAMVASDSVIIPVQCEYFAMEAVAAVLSSITTIQQRYNPSLTIEGLLLTMYDPRTRLGTEVTREVRGLFKENTFSSVVPRNISIPEASARGEPVTSFRPNAQGSLAYFALAREVIDHEKNA